MTAVQAQAGDTDAPVAPPQRAARSTPRALDGPTQRATLERVISQSVLPNGLEVIVVENHNVPLATVEVVVKNGSFTQEPQDEGVAHLFEHMLFRAYTDTTPDASFARAAGEITAGFNGTTNEESVTYYATLPSRHLERGVQLLATLMRRPRFRADDLNRERQVVLGEYDRQVANPFYHLRAATGRALWSSAWSRKNTLGSREAINSATVERLETIFKRYYVPNNSALVVTGDVTPQQVFELARKHFGPWQRGPDPFAAFPIPPVPPLERDTTVIVEADTRDVVVMLQWQGPSVGRDPDATYAADVFSDVLNAPTSEFRKKLVDSGLWQSLGVNYYTLDQVGPITILGETTPENLRAALAALYGEIARLGDPRYFSAQALADSKQDRKVGTAFGLERASGFAHTIAFWWSVADLEYYMGYVDNMAAQTARDLADYGGKYIAGRPKVIGLMMSAEEAGKWR
ncbi:MAG TPA: pitrilysin family protein [Gemmatimonadaceae bacterium]|nr:pitrilysin family protein [Gemmatimonadaceae bacterium]